MPFKVLEPGDLINLKLNQSNTLTWSLGESTKSERRTARSRKVAM